MKYYLVNNLDEIVPKVDLGDDIGLSGARTYFIGTKKIEENSFDKLWKVMSMERYDIIREASSRDGKQYEWWKDEPTKPDEGFDY